MVLPEADVCQIPETLSTTCSMLLQSRAKLPKRQMNSVIQNNLNTTVQYNKMFRKADTICHRASLVVLCKG